MFSFFVVYGVWYNENGYLWKYLDRMWDWVNKMLWIEWVFLILFGIMVCFIYYYLNNGEGYYGIDILLDFGDVFLFNGVYFYYGV